MKLSARQINEIAQELEGGMKVFVKRENLEIKSIFDWEESYGDNEFWEEEMETIEREWSDYMTLTKMESWEAFQIMEDFVDEIDDESMKESLRKILGRKSPFANFKAEVESSAYRQNWFDFRQKKYEDYVSEELRMSDFEIE